MQSRFIATTAIAIACLALALAGDATARTGDAVQTWANWQEIGAMANCDDDSINAAVICGDTFGVKVESYNLATFEIIYTLSAGTGWSFYLETCFEGHATPDCTAAGDWHQVVTQHVITGTGIVLSADPITHVAAATDRITW